MATQLSSDEQARLGDALAAVCREAGLDPTGAKLMKYTMNAVYRLDSAGVVLRVAPGTMAERVDRVVQAASLFSKVGAPVVALAPGYEHAIHVEGWSASVWTLVPHPTGTVWEPGDLAGPLRAIHAIDDSRFFGSERGLTGDGQSGSGGSCQATPSVGSYRRCRYRWCAD